MRLRGERSADDNPLRLRQPGQVGGALAVLRHHLGDGRSAERTPAQTQLGVADRETVQVAAFAAPGLPGLRRHVRGRPAQYARLVCLADFLELNQSEVGNLDVTGQEQQVVRLDVAVQDLVAVQKVQRLGGLPEVAEQFLQRDAALPLALLEAAAQGLVGQLHRDVQPPSVNPASVRREQIGMAQLLHRLQRLQLALRWASSSWRWMTLTAAGKPPGARAFQTSPNDPPPRRDSR